MTDTRPSVDDVAVLLRARTKDSEGREVGTFNDETRPTAEQVERHIDNAVSLLATRMPLDLPVVYEGTVKALTAYRAALQIEKSFFPEQVRSDRSAYDQLREEYNDDLTALMDALAGAGGDDGSGSAGHRAHSEWTPTFLFASQYPEPNGGLIVYDRYPEPENPGNWAQPLQPPREPPYAEDLPVGDEPASGVTWGDVAHSRGTGAPAIIPPPRPVAPSLAYDFDPALTQAPPDSGQALLDDPHPPGTTRLFLSYVNRNGIDCEAYIRSFGLPDNGIYIAEADTSLYWVHYIVEADPIWHADYVEYLVSVATYGLDLTAAPVDVTINWQEPPSPT